MIDDNNVSKNPQTKAPIHEALSRYKEMRVLPFDVPGHKQGRGNEELRNFLGADCLKIDVNSMKPLDNLSHPTGVIKEAEALAAKAFGSDHAFFMVNGTTSSVQAMLMASLKDKDKVIMPRNVHRSAINSLVLIGAEPVYVNPGIHERLGISMGMDAADVKAAIKENPDAKAVFVNNPTYYGVCSDLKAIVRAAHESGMTVLVDEAHGTHFYFGENLPVSAMEAGADMASISMHKTGGSLTQSSLLLVNGKNADYVRTIINLTQTTSASYLLMCSLDIARRNLALNGHNIFHKVMALSSYAREEINKIGGYYAFGAEIKNGGNAFDMDITKLCVHTLDVGLAGIEIYDLLRDEYDIQIEFGDIGNMLAVISVGDNNYAIERLVAALSEIRRRYGKSRSGLLDYEYIKPKVVTTPKKAFYSDKERLELTKAEGRVSGEFVMCYPPGIPILAPGEMITKEAIEYIVYSKQKGCLVTGAEDLQLNFINTLRS